MFAPNVWTGGGLVLLRSLLEAEWPLAQRVAYLDERARDAIGADPAGFTVRWVAPGLRGRLTSERDLALYSREGDTTLCFHSLPPLLRLRGETACFVQNAYVVREIPGARHRGRTRLRVRLERLIARCLSRNCDRYIVQTPTMRASVENRLAANGQKVDILPIAPLACDGDRGLACRTTTAAPEQLDFLYVSDGQPHKNHARLFEAWQILAAEALLPSLVVTLYPGRDAHLVARVRSLANQGIAITDVGHVPRETLFELYGWAGALIFPSTAESFGNPLAEATALGLPIIAPEMDYVRDVCVPTETFDAYSARSIARAVKRFLRLAEIPPVAMAGSAFARALLADRPACNSAGLSRVDWASGREKAPWSTE